MEKKQLGVYDLTLTLNCLHPLEIDAVAALKNTACEFKNKVTISGTEEPVYSGLLELTSIKQVPEVLIELFWLSFCCFYQMESKEIIVNLITRNC
jgi:PDZ domain-containing secreted protein